MTYFRSFSLCLALSLAFPLQAENPGPVTITTSHPFFLRLTEVEKAHNAAPNDLVQAYNCDRVVSLPALDRNTASIPTTQMQFKLEQTGYYVKDVIALIGMTQTGKTDAPAFQRKYEAGEIKITHISNEGAKNCPKMAAACFASSTKTMFIDKSTELGTLAPVLYHEIIHALDEDLSRSLSRLPGIEHSLTDKATSVITATAKRLNKSPNDLKISDFEARDMEEVYKLKASLYHVGQIASFKTERRAYDGGFKIQNELAMSFPNYYNRGDHLSQFSPSDDEIVSSYSLNASVIGRFKKGQCQKIP